MRQKVSPPNIPLISFVWLCLCLLFFTNGCTSTNYAVHKATAQTWYGGAAGSGGGRIYKIFISKSPKTTLAIDEVWVGKPEGGTFQRFRAFQDSSNTAYKDGKITSGAKLVRIEFSENFPRRPDPRQQAGKEEDNPQEVQPKENAPTTLPADFKQGVVIVYSSGGKKGYWVVSDFVKLPPLAYP